MEDELSLALYALLCFVGILFVTNAGYILTTIYEAPPIPMLSSKTLKGSLMTRNAFLLLLAACNVLRAFTLYLTGAARDECLKETYDTFYAATLVAKDVTNVAFALGLSTITLFFVRLYKAQSNPRLFKYIFVLAIVALLMYAGAGIVLAIQAEEPATYDWTNSLIFVIAFAMLLAMILRYGTRLLIQVMEKRAEGGEMISSQQDFNMKVEAPSTPICKVYFLYSIP